MSYNDLLSKVEAAAKAVADGLDLSQDYTINTGIEDAEAQLPIIILTALETGEEIPKGSGNFVVTLQVMIKNNPADVTFANHRADVAVLFDAFRQDNIGATFSANEGLHVYDPPKDVRLNSDQNEEVMINVLELDILACPSDL